MNNLLDEIQIIFEDPYLLIVSKPAGLNADIDRQQHPSVEGWSIDYLSRTPFLVNRIDRPTSGLMILAKNKTTLHRMEDLLREGKLAKKYFALVSGNPGPQEDTLIDFVKKDPMQKRLLVLPGAENGNTQKAELKYKKIRNTGDYTLLEIQLITGRYHQIRAQLAHRGWPVLGDAHYGSSVEFGETKIALHSWKTEFLHPVTGEQLSIEAPLPSFWPE